MVDERSRLLSTDSRLEAHEGEGQEIRSALDLPLRTKIVILTGCFFAVFLNVSRDLPCPGMR